MSSLISREEVKEESKYQPSKQTKYSKFVKGRKHVLYLDYWSHKQEPRYGENRKILNTMTYSDAVHRDHAKVCNEFNSQINMSAMSNLSINKAIDNVYNLKSYGNITKGD